MVEEKTSFGLAVPSSGSCSNCLNDLNLIADIFEREHNIVNVGIFTPTALKWFLKVLFWSEGSDCKFINIRSGHFDTILWSIRYSVTF